MKLKIKISKEKLKEVEERLDDGVEIEFHDENNMKLENWIITTEIVGKEIFNEKEAEISEIINEENNVGNENIMTNDESNKKDNNEMNECSNNESDINESMGNTTDNEEILENKRNKRERKRTEKEPNDTKKNDKGKKIRIEDEESTEEEEIVENGMGAFERLLKDLSTPVIEEQLIEEENIGEVTLEKLFIRAERGSQELVKYWFDVGEEFRNEIRRIKDETKMKERTIRSNIYNRLEKNLRGRTRNTIQTKLTRAEQIYKLFKGIGGKEKIDRMRNTCMSTIMELRFRKGEIDELIKKINEIEEERNNIMED